MRKTTSKRLTCLALSLLMFASTLPAAVLAAEEVAETTPQKTTLQEISETLNSYSYADYRAEYADAARGTGTVEIKVRRTGEVQVVPREACLQTVQSLLTTL